MSRVSQFGSNSQAKHLLDSKDPLIYLERQNRQQLPKQHIHQSVNITQRKFDEIKRKYGSKSRNTASPYKSSALEQISLRHSNYSNLFKSGVKNINSDQKVFEARSSSFYDANKIQPFLFYDKPIIKQQLQQTSSKSDLFAQINFPFKSSEMKTRLDGSKITRSIDYSNLENRRKDKGTERISSIDKIKTKINQILNCQNQKQHIQQKFIINANVEKPSQTKQVNSNISSNFNQKLVKQQENKESILSNILGRISKRTDFSLDKMRRYSVNSENRDSFKNLKQSIVYGDKSRCRENSILKNRDIDEQIKRIQDRMKKTQQEKKKLNIVSEQFNDVNVPKRLSNYSKISQKTSLLLQRKNRLYCNNISKQQKCLQNENQTFISKKQIVQNKGQIQPPPSILKQSTRHNNESIHQSRNQLKKSRQSQKKSQIHQSFNNNISQQPKKQTRRLIQAFKNQVSYDECFRNAKVLLQQIYETTKYETIQNIISKQGINYSIQQIKKQLQLTPEQHNPFFSVRHSSQSIQQLISKFTDSYFYWKNSIVGKFDRNLLKKQNFTQYCIDLQKNGSLKVEDLVRFLNIQTGNFYRNRDVVLLFKRITPNQTMTFEELIDILCF